MSRKPPRSTEERLVRWQRSMAPGTLGGRVASAAPMVLDVTRLDPRLRANHGGGGGFDATADPVIIGFGATAADLGDVSLGYGATVSGIRATGVGYGVSVSGDHAQAFGDSAVSSGLRSSAIGQIAQATANYAQSEGYNARALATNAMAYGVNSTARGIDSASFGPRADAEHDGAVAIGADCVTTGDYQLMLGCAYVEVAGSGIVYTDAVTGTRYLMQVASGAVVLNAAP